VWEEAAINIADTFHRHIAHLAQKQEPDSQQKHRQISSKYDETAIS